MKSAWLFPALEGTKASVESDPPRDFSVDWRVRDSTWIGVLELLSDLDSQVQRLEHPEFPFLAENNSCEGTALSLGDPYFIVILIRNSHHEIS